MFWCTINRYAHGRPSQKTVTYSLLLAIYRPCFFFSINQFIKHTHQVSRATLWHLPIPYLFANSPKPQRFLIYRYKTNLCHFFLDKWFKQLGHYQNLRIMFCRAVIFTQWHRITTLNRRHPATNHHSFVNLPGDKRMKIRRAWLMPACWSRFCLLNSNSLNVSGKKKKGSADYGWVVVR